MSDKIQAVLFDIDGTLLDASEFIYQAYEYTFQVHGLPKIPRVEIGQLMGQSLVSIYDHFFPQHDTQLLCEAHYSFEELNVQLAQPFPAILSGLQMLTMQSVKLAAITSRSRRTSLKTLELAQLSQYFPVVISAEDVPRTKPDPTPLLLALEKLHVSPQNAIMVGDTAADILAGKNAGMQTIGVTYGFHGQKIIDSQPDYMATSSTQLFLVLSQVLLK